MNETSWGQDTHASDIDWRMSAALENVTRGTSELAEVTNLAGAVTEWQRLDPANRTAAVLTPERPIVIDGKIYEALTGQAIVALVNLLPPNG